MDKQFNILKFLTEHLKTFYGIGVINLKTLSATDFLPEEIQAECPEYLKRTWHIRRAPKNFVPWARSCLVFAVPFIEIPDMKSTLPEATVDSRAGLVSAYAVKKLDYHIHIKKLISSFAESFKFALGTEMRSEICVDTKPIPEKPLSITAGMAKLGRNSCARIQGLGACFFLGELFIDKEIPSVLVTRKIEKTISVNCDSCLACLRRCPTGAINSESNAFIYKKCICYLNMEKKGDLSEDEKKMLGKWLFGCDECVSACPDSKIDMPFKLDLDWLIRADESEVKNAIKDMALEYAGVNKLKRNASIIISNFV